MIDKKIVLILGAGASKPYDFPTGGELKRNIIDDLKPNTSTTSTLQEALNGLNFPKDKIESFWNDLRRSPLESVDIFLESRPEFIEIGKCCIAAKIMWCEQEHKLDGAKDGWYDLLYKRMHTSSHKDFPLNKIKIITFNYDRSVEQFMFKSLKSTYGLDIMKCAELISKLAIVHVYGRLSPLNWEDPDGQSYIQNRYRPEQIRQSAEHIKIMPEGSDDSTDFRTARQWISAAEEIHFLGFGYNEVNLRRLGFGAESNFYGRGTGMHIGNVKQSRVGIDWHIDVVDQESNISQYFLNHADF